MPPTPPVLCPFSGSSGEKIGGESHHPGPVLGLLLLGAMDGVLREEGSIRAPPSKDGEGVIKETAIGKIHPSGGARVALQSLADQDIFGIDALFNDVGLHRGNDQPRDPEHLASTRTTKASNGLLEGFQRRSVRSGERGDSKGKPLKEVEASKPVQAPTRIP